MIHCVRSFCNLWTD